MRTLLGLTLGCLLAGAAIAADKEPRVSQLEASMLVSGEMSVDASGTVTGYTLDEADKLPPPVKDLLAKTLPTFRFQPVEHEGKAQPVQATMSLQLVAHQIDPDHFDLRLRSARFTDKAESAASMTSTAAMWIEKLPRMHYPDTAVMAGVSATVYLALRFDRTGKVIDVDVSQVNLRTGGDPLQMTHWRALFANSAMSDARKIVLHVPTSGPHANDATFTGTLPVVYLWEDQRPAGNGEWDSYVRGPVHPIAWIHDEDAAANETVPDGQFALSGDSLKLLTPPGG